LATLSQKRGRSPPRASGRQAPLEIDAPGMGRRGKQNFRICRQSLAQSGRETYNRRDEKPDRRKPRDRPQDFGQSFGKTPPRMAFCNRSGLARSRTKFLTPIARNPLKRLISKK
jgi:hypothetical protein